MREAFTSSESAPVRAIESRIQRQTACRAAAILAMSFGSVVVCSCPAFTADTPNVLLIMTDDQGWGDIRSHGNPQIDTPVLDKLAADGCRFERFFVSPVCAPTRSSLLTGRYNLRTGTHGVTRGRENMRAEEVTVAEAFKAAGYSTGCFGKWHNGRHYPYHPNGQGFDEFVGFCAGHWNNYFDTELERNGQPIPTQGYITDVLTGHAIEFIERNAEKPFFCYVPYNAPHSPWQVPDEYFEKYASLGLTPQENCAFAMCTNIDDNVGRLLKKLDELKLARNTIVVFLTDNGPNSKRFNGNMKGRKGSCHEGGVRVPLFIRWPGRIEPEAAVDRIAMHIDLFPTLVELAGIEMPRTLPHDGRSLAPLILGEQTDDWPDRMLFTFRSTGNNGAVRTQRWRAVKYQQWELYDMHADPEQKQNVARENRQILGDLSSAYDVILESATKPGLAPLPIPIGHPGRNHVTLPGHEAFLHPEVGDGISYVGKSGWANDWVTNWTNAGAYPWWDVDVIRAGRYEVRVDFTCPVANIGAKLRVAVGSALIDGSIDRGHDPEPIDSPDRIPRIEVYEKQWASARFGILELRETGRGRLVLEARRQSGGRMPDIKAVRLRRIGD